MKNVVKRVALILAMAFVLATVLTSCQSNKPLCPAYGYGTVGPLR